MSHPSAPAYDALPQARTRAVRRGPERAAFALQLEVVTPILGGGPKLRALDDVDIIRTPTIRGHLRFWWRALYGHQFDTPEKLYQQESGLWGCAAAEDAGGRSAVELRVVVEKSGDVDEEDIALNTIEAYALWPARAERMAGTAPAPRRRPGTQFRLEVCAPEDKVTDVKKTLRAWVLFGGYGSRTRRGLGSLTVREASNEWLPQEATREAFQQLFCTDIFNPPGRDPGDVALLAGAYLHVGQVQGSAPEAWRTALLWLKDFRQGTQHPRGERAREPGQGNRPSISNWPEADKIRHLTGKTKAHTPHARAPRHNSIPVWPRAGFGLPIVGQFQKKDPQGREWDEPGPFCILWRGRDGVEHDRLASPLVVKAMSLADGRYVPIALWLNRAYPKGGEVFLDLNANSSGAPFDQLKAPQDKTWFNPLQKQRLRDAFLDWLSQHYKTTKIAP